MSEESVDDLNKRLTKPVPITQFRPNIVIKGGPLFAEEKWDYIKIGGAIFRNVKPCTRYKSSPKYSEIHFFTSAYSSIGVWQQLSILFWV